MATRATTKTGSKKSGPATDLISKPPRAPRPAPAAVEPKQEEKPPTPEPAPKAVKETVSLIEPKVKAPRQRPAPHEGKVRSVLPPISRIRAPQPAPPPAQTPAAPAQPAHAAEEPA